MKQLKPIVIHLDELTQVCGHYNGSTPVNNFYGCDHPDCGESELVKIDKDGSHRRGDWRERDIKRYFMRKVFGNFNSVDKALETEQGRKLYLSIDAENEEVISQAGFHQQGACFDYSCPLASSCDLDALKEHLPDEYENWKNEEYGPDECGANLMLVYDEDTLQKMLHS